MSDTQSAIEALDADLLRLHKALFQHRSWMLLQKQAGVTIDRAGAALLKAVAHGHGKSSRLHDIAQFLGIEAPSLSRKVQQLESEGLISRKPDPKDGRAFNLVITRKGTAQLAKLQKARQAQLQTVFADWSAKDQQTFLKLLHDFNEKLITQITTNEQE